MEPKLTVRELTLEYRNIPAQDPILEEQIERTLKKLESSLKRQMLNYPDWDTTLRIQAILLCEDCSKEKSTRIEYTATKHTKLARCMHLIGQSNEEANS